MTHGFHDSILLMCGRVLVYLNFLCLPTVFPGLHWAFRGWNLSAVLIARERPALPIFSRLSTEHQRTCNEIWGLGW